MWQKKIVTWNFLKVLYISVPFTWLLPEAKLLAQRYKGKVILGGPAVYLMEDWVSTWAEVGRELSFIDPLELHNPFATFTTRGCVNSCSFCAVPKIEGEFRENKTWKIRPIVCDNNFLAASKRHIIRVIDSFSDLPIVDFNQGLDVRLLKKWHLEEIRKLKKVQLRFAFDNLNEETKVYDAILSAQKEGFKNISVYVLVGFNDCEEEARYRLEKVKEWGARPDPMRYQPLDTLQKNSFVGANWTDAQLHKICRYYFRSSWVSHIPYDDFNKKEEGFGL